MKIPHLRWWIAGLLMAASVLNYLDRTALGVASARIRDELHLSASQYALVVNAFLVAYTLSYFFGGMVVDRLGTRLSILVTVSWWSLANMAHALARNLPELMGFRFLLGLGEASFYPASLRAAAEWFRPRDRSKAVGMILAGASLGALLAPLIVARMMAMPGVGWRGAFVLTGALGFVLVPLWLFFYRPPGQEKRLTDEEREYLSQQETTDAADARPWPLRDILGNRQARVLIMARALTDAAWFLLLFWLIQYLQKERGFSDLMVAQAGWIPFLTADLGALFGGWFSSALIARGIPVSRARTTSMLGFTLLLPLCLVAYLLPPDAPFAALALFSIATFGHMAFGTNNLTLHSDLFPPNCVATIMGVTGAAGSIGGILAQQTVGRAVDVTGSYLPVFIVTACCHPLAGLLVVLGLGSARPVSRPTTVE